MDLTTVETNMVMVRVDGLLPEELCQRLQTMSADEVAQTGHAVRVLLSPGLSGQCEPCGTTMSLQRTPSWRWESGRSC